MSFFYNLAYFIFGIFYLPVFLKKISQAENPKKLFRQRSGRLEEDVRLKLLGKKVIWIHAVSVGEVMAMRRFITAWLERDSESHLVLTTVTPTGQKIAREMEGARVSVLYFPFDLSWACRGFFESLRPKILLLAETEIWPNLLLEAKRAGVTVGILNARLSPKSFGRYEKLRFIFEPLLKTLGFVLAQTPEDADRFSRLGVPGGSVHVLGNMKFDNVVFSEPDPKAEACLRKEWGFEVTDRILVAGSTHPGEEEIVLKAFRQLRQEFPGLRMILAPRHIERSAQLVVSIRQSGLRAAQASDRGVEENFDVLVLNQLGILKHIYRIADAAYVGGSLVRKGGQNPIEPAVFKKPIVHGPYVYNFEKIYRDLDRKGGALAVHDKEELIIVLKRLLGNASERETLGAQAFQMISALQGATQRHLDWVLNFLAARSQERTCYGDIHAKLFPSTGGRL